MPTTNSGSETLRVLVVDDDPHERQLVATLLSAAGGLEAVPIPDALALGEELSRGAFDALVLGAPAQWAGGLALLDAVKRAGPARAVVLLTAPGAWDASVGAAFRRGLDDAVARCPRAYVELADTVRACVRRASAEAAPRAASGAAAAERAAVTAHELQEPLRTMARAAEALRSRWSGRLDREADEQLVFLHDAAQRLQGRVRRLLAGSPPAPEPPAAAAPPAPPPSAPSPSPPPGPGTDASAVLQQALAHLRAAIEASGAQLTCEPLPHVAVDADALLQLLQNLLANALKFHREGEPPRVRVSAEPHGVHWLFSVADDGIGIPAEHLERIFGMFERGDTAGRYPGTGIGLAVCRRIVERHGGRIWAQSQPPGGATFFFTLPGILQGDGRTG